MAAAARQALMRPAHILGSNVKDLLSHHDHDADSSRRDASAEQQDLGEQERQERDFIAHNNSSSAVLSPSEIAQDPKKKDLGKSSRALRIQDFDLLKTLGTGTFARVWLSRLTNPQNEEEKKSVYALKILRKVDVIRLKQVEHVRNERSTLGAVAGHPFITKLIRTFADRDCLYMLLDYCPGGEVFTYLRRARRFPEATARFYAAEIVLILEFLHEVEGIAYRDLKPENILLDADGHLKLVDFGFAKKIGKTETYTLCGTPEYLAPEVIRNTGKGTAVDWWAFGILLYEFLLGQPPFWDPNPMKIYSKIVAGNIPFPQPPSQSQHQPASGGSPNQAAKTAQDPNAPDRGTGATPASPHLRPTQQSSGSNNSGKEVHAKPHHQPSHAQPQQTSNSPYSSSPNSDPSPNNTTNNNNPNPQNLLPSPAARSLILGLCTVNPSQRLGNIAGGVQRVKDHEFFAGIDWDTLYWRRVRGPIIPRWSGGADASCFDDYDDPPGTGDGSVYTTDLEKEWEGHFAEF